MPLCFSIDDTRNPTTAWKVEAIRAWLVENDVDLPVPAPGRRVVKADLLRVAKQHRIEPKYEFDELMTLHGHEVVRIPPYHSELNAIEFAWGQVKRCAASMMKSFTVREAKEAFEAGHKRVTDKGFWASNVAHVEEVEKE